MLFVMLRFRGRRRLPPSFVGWLVLLVIHSILPHFGIKTIFRSGSLVLPAYFIVLRLHILSLSEKARRKTPLWKPPLKSALMNYYE